jgi:hypothetical protein
MRSKKFARKLVALSFVAALLAAAPQAARADTEPFNDEYIFAATKAVNDMDASPAAKVTLYPLTFVIDTAFLPFAVIAGFVA